MFTLPLVLYSVPEIVWTKEKIFLYWNYQNCIFNKFIWKCDLISKIVLGGWLCNLLVFNHVLSFTVFFPPEAPWMKRSSSSTLIWMMTISVVSASSRQKRAPCLSAMSALNSALKVRDRRRGDYCLFALQNEKQTQGKWRSLHSTYIFALANVCCRLRCAEQVINGNLFSPFNSWTCTHAHLLVSGWWGSKLEFNLISSSFTG